MKKPTLPYASEPWFALLLAEVGRTNQTQAASRIGVSVSTVNQILKGTYWADLARMKQRIEEELSEAEVTCPVLGVIPQRRCKAERERPFAATNPLRVRLFRTCPSCPCNPHANDE